MAQLHEVCYPLFKWVLWYATDGDMSSVDTEAYRAIARKFWGSDEAADYSTYAGKAMAAFMIQNRTYAKETLTACDFFYPIVTPEGAPDHVGDPSIESRLLSAVTGIDFDEAAYNLAGERVFNLTRAIHAREGHIGRRTRHTAGIQLHRATHLRQKQLFLPVQPGVHAAGQRRRAYIAPQRKTRPR